MAGLHDLQGCDATRMYSYFLGEAKGARVRRQVSAPELRQDEFDSSMASDRDSEVSQGEGEP